MKWKSKKVLWLMSVWIVSVMHGGFASADDLDSPALSRQAIKAAKELQDPWSKKIKKASKRFQIVLDGEGVLDKETGLVLGEVSGYRNQNVGFCCVLCLYQ